MAVAEEKPDGEKKSAGGKHPLKKRLHETTMWERRIAAFEGCELKMQRIVAFKPGAEIL